MSLMDTSRRRAKLRKREQDQRPGKHYNPLRETFGANNMRAWSNAILEFEMQGVGYQDVDPLSNQASDTMMNAVGQEVQLDELDLLPLPNTKTSKATGPQVDHKQIRNTFGPKHAKMIADAVKKSPREFQGWYSNAVMTGQEVPDELIMDVLEKKPTHVTGHMKNQREIQAIVNTAQKEGKKLGLVLKNQAPELWKSIMHVIGTIGIEGDVSPSISKQIKAQRKKAAQGSGKTLEYYKYGKDQDNRIAQGDDELDDELIGDLEKEKRRKEKEKRRKEKEKALAAGGDGDFARNKLERELNEYGEDELRSLIMQAESRLSELSEKDDEDEDNMPYMTRDQVDEDDIDYVLEDDDDPCWKNYKMVGTKKKNGKEVPNCVPKNESVFGEEEEFDDELDESNYSTVKAGSQSGHGPDPKGRTEIGGNGYDLDDHSVDVHGDDSSSYPHSSEKEYVARAKHSRGDNHVYEGEDEDDDESVDEALSEMKARFAEIAALAEGKMPKGLKDYMAKKGKGKGKGKKGDDDEKVEEGHGHHRDAKQKKKKEQDKRLSGKDDDEKVDEGHGHHRDAKQKKQKEQDKRLSGKDDDEKVDEAHGHHRTARQEKEKKRVAAVNPKHDDEDEDEDTSRGGAKSGNPRQRKMSVSESAEKKSMSATGKGKMKITLSPRKNEDGEYVVKFYGEDGRYKEGPTYYTDDWEDAVGTFKDMCKRNNCK